MLYTVLNFSCKHLLNLTIHKMHVYLQSVELYLANTIDCTYASRIALICILRLTICRTLNLETLSIGVGRFIILGERRFRILGGGGEVPNSKQEHDVVLTSMRRNDVASTSFRRHLPTRFLINQYQIITFLILKSDNIENSRIELKGIVLPVPSNQIKVTFIIILPFNLVHL